MQASVLFLLTLWTKRRSRITEAPSIECQEPAKTKCWNVLEIEVDIWLRERETVTACWPWAPWERGSLVSRVFWPSASTLTPHGKDAWRVCLKGKPPARHFFCHLTQHDMCPCSNADLMLHNLALLTVANMGLCLQCGTSASDKGMRCFFNTQCWGWVRFAAVSVLW